MPFKRLNSVFDIPRLRAWLIMAGLQGERKARNPLCHNLLRVLVAVTRIERVTRGL